MNLTEVQLTAAKAAAARRLEAEVAAALKSGGSTHTEAVHQAHVALIKASDAEMQPPASQFTHLRRLEK